MPVPLSAGFCGLVVVLSVSARVAVWVPTASGVNVTPSVHEVLGASVIGIAPHVPPLVAANSAVSDGVALEMTSGWVAPVLLTVSVFVAVWPRATLPNAAAVTVIEVVGVAVGVAVAVLV